MKYATHLLIALVLVSAFALVLAPTAQATEFRGGETVVIAADETVRDDLYVTADRVVVDGTVDGDLIASGSTIIVNGVVTGDLLAAGQDIVINGVIEDDVRMAGATLSVSAGGRVADEIMSAGFSLNLATDSQVGGDVTFFGGQAAIDGTVDGNLNVSANRLRVDGAVSGNVNASVDNAEQAQQFDVFLPITQNLGIAMVEPGFTEGESSAISGEVNVDMPDVGESGPADDVINDAVTAVVAPAAPEPQTLILDTLQEFLNRFILLGIVALIVYLAAPRLVRGSAIRLRGSPPAGFGWGLLWYFGVPILLILIAVAAIAFASFFGLIGLGSVGGALVTYTFIFLAAVLLLFILILALLAKIIAGYALGGSILRSTSNDSPWLVMLIGLGLVALLIALPYVGFVFNFIFSAAGLGSLWFSYRDRNGRSDPEYGSTDLLLASDA